jgi:hypothetical protein
LTLPAVTLVSVPSQRSVVVHVVPRSTPVEYRPMTLNFPWAFAAR